MASRYRMTIRRSTAQQGFSLIELMIVLLILSVITAAIFKQIDQVQQRSATEQSKLDMFQESREFMDQLSRDLRQAGYPNVRNFLPSALFADPSHPSSPYYKSANAAVGLVKVDNGDLWFEGDVNGDGYVYEVVYHLDTSTTNSCPCLRRSTVQKIQADPVTGQTTPVYQVEVQNVLNGSSSNPIFYAYPHGSGGTAATLPIDFDNNASTIASIDTIKIVLTVQGKNPDPKTGQYPVTTLVSTVRLNNCSSAASAQYMSCQ